MKKILFRIILFFALFILLLQLVSNMFVMKGSGYGTDVISFYNEPKNSLDMIFFGSSHSYSTFSPEIIYKETGLKSYNFATQQQPLWITYHYMKESLKYQKPKYMVVEILMAASSENYMSEAVNRDAIDKMRPSLNKIEVINASVEKIDDRLSYYFNIIKYHDRWNNIIKNDVTDYLRTDPNKGFTYLNGNRKKAIKTNVKKISEKEKISLKNEIYLNKIISLGKENNIELIFVKTPCSTTIEEHKKYNYVKNIVQSYNYKYINYNEKYDELELDFEKDFYDSGHLVGKAALKVTKHFSNYLKETFSDDE